jgi:hypothetical protein
MTTVLAIPRPTSPLAPATRVIVSPAPAASCLGAAPSSAAPLARGVVSAGPVAVRRRARGASCGRLSAPMEVAA